MASTPPCWTSVWFTSHGAVPVKPVYIAEDQNLPNYSTYIEQSYNYINYTPTGVRRSRTETLMVERTQKGTEKACVWGGMGEPQTLHVALHDVIIACQTLHILNTHELTPLYRRSRSKLNQQTGRTLSWSFLKNGWRFDRSERFLVQF